MSITTNLVSHWKLDEASGNAADSVGSNTLTNQGTLTYQAGKIHNGALFANTKYLTGSFASTPGDQTYNFWVKPTDNVAQYPFIQSDTFIAIYLKTTQVVGVDVPGVVGILDSGTNKVSNGVWTMITMTRSGNDWVLYFNASSVGTATVTATQTNTNTFALGNNPAGAQKYVGMMDEVSYYTRALTSTEIIYLYNHKGGRQYPLSNLTGVTAAM